MMEPMDETVPTTAQEEQFRTAVRNFVKRAPNHRQVLADSRFSPAPENIDNWIGGKDLPELTWMSRIMDFIWSHRCNCSCNGDRN
ncbi:MAG TPA: hypothetical protein VJC06_01745 [Candidatus Paceibacterota bacterium]